MVKSSTILCYRFMRKGPIELLLAENGNMWQDVDY